jgi:plasmid maintenance system killer protein
LNIRFKTKKLAKIFNDAKLLDKEYGRQCSRAIQRRMRFLEAACCLADVPVEKPDRRHQLTGNKKDHFAVDVKHPYRIVFKPDHDPIPKTGDNSIDLSMVTDIEIVAVEDYH